MYTVLRSDHYVIIQTLMFQVPTRLSRRSGYVNNANSTYSSLRRQLNASKIYLVWPLTASQTTFRHCRIVLILYVILVALSMKLHISIKLPVFAIST